MVREIAVGRVGASQHLKPFTWLQSHLLKTTMYNNNNNNNNNNKQQFQSISIPFFFTCECDVNITSHVNLIGETVNILREKIVNYSPFFRGTR